MELGELLKPEPELKVIEGAQTYYLHEVTGATHYLYWGNHLRVRKVIDDVIVSGLEAKGFVKVETVEEADLEVYPRLWQSFLSRRYALADCRYQELRGFGRFRGFDDREISFSLAVYRRGEESLLWRRESPWPVEVRFLTLFRLESMVERVTNEFPESGESIEE